jgi:3-isopropylmalate/(R)-2-methylmalate dehydratase small subunit
VALDLQKGKVTAGDLTIDVTLPPAARESFLDGTWDATGLLLDRYEDVEAVAAKLPYISGWR